MFDPIKLHSGFNTISQEGQRKPIALQLELSLGKAIRKVNFRFPHLFSFCYSVVLVFLFHSNFYIFQSWIGSTGELTVNFPWKKEQWLTFKKTGQDQASLHIQLKHPLGRPHPKTTRLSATTDRTWGFAFSLTHQKM